MQFADKPLAPCLASCPLTDFGHDCARKEERSGLSLANTALGGGAGKTVKSEQVDLTAASPVSTSSVDDLLSVRGKRHSGFCSGLCCCTADTASPGDVWESRSSAANLPNPDGALGRMMKRGQSERRCVSLPFCACVCVICFSWLSCSLIRR